MNPDILEKVLACKELPSLPAVALRVVELSSDDDVAVKDLASTIQNDQGLSAKVLKTVNSSLFALRSRCTTIDQAIVLLGLRAVKTLALGFSLVTAVDNAVDKDEFDMTNYWKRALYTGIAAKCIASDSHGESPEECFLGGLLQDVGMIALLQTLKDDYARLVLDTGEHAGLAKRELDELGVQHSDIGALLAQRWKLPHELVMPIKYHERPTAAPSDHSVVCRTVGLGNLAAGTLVNDDPLPALQQFYSKANLWFKLSNQQADDILSKIGATTKEFARLLSLRVGDIEDPDSILNSAREQIAAVSINSNQHTPSIPIKDEPDTIDELTGLANQRVFDRSMIVAFEQLRAGVEPLSVAYIDVDGVQPLVEEHGEEALDNILITLAGRVEDQYAKHNALVCMIGKNRFGVIMPRISKADASAATETIRQSIAADPIDLITSRTGKPAKVRVTASIGLISLQQMNDKVDSAGDITDVLERAVAAARRAGENTIRVFSPAAAAA